MRGININSAEIDFAEEILNGNKTIETRKTNSLDTYIGERVGIIKTGCGQAMLVGFMTISGKKTYLSPYEFRSDYRKHLVEPNSKYDGGKVGYYVSNVERCEPKPIYKKGIIGAVDI